jgi:hypothetical protein
MSMSSVRTLVLSPIFVKLLPKRSDLRQKCEPFPTFPAQANCRCPEGSVLSGSFYNWFVDLVDLSQEGENLRALVNAVMNLRVQ